MKEPHSESLANYADLESCAGAGDSAGEALTGALAGRLLSREIPLFGCRPCGQKGKATSTVALSQAASEPGAVGDPVHVRKLLAREPGDFGERLLRSGRPVGEGASRTPHAYVAEESEREVVPMNDSNKGGQPPAESREGSNRAKENVQRPRTGRAQQRAAVSQGLEGVRQAARRKTTGKFTSLLHHLTPELLRSSFYALKRQVAAGVDGVSWREYESGLEDRLVDLDSRVQRGAYRAQPSRRMYILKPDGRQRPLGIAALEDKIVQQAVVTRLLSIPRGAGKPAPAGGISLGAGPALAAVASAARPETPDKLGPVLPAAGRISAAATMLSPVSKCALAATHPR